jgi:hypothetical protein
MTQSPAGASGDQPPAGTGLTAQDLAARLEAGGELTAEDIAALARFDDGPDAAGGSCDDYADCDGEPPAQWLVLPDDEHAALLTGGTSGPAVAEALDAGFTRRCASPGATGFAAGGPLDVMLPGPDLGWHAGQARRRGLSKLSDDELCGLLGSARKLGSWAAELEVAAITELDARRTGANGRPGEHVAEEVAAELTLTPGAADTLLGLGRNLARLPQTRALLAAGFLDPDRAEVIANALAVLDDAGAAAVENQITPKAADLTTGQLRAACERAIKAYDPRAAKERREKAQKDARVECWAEAAGTSALAGRDLSPAGVITADKALDADARWLRAHGMPGSHDQLRAAAFLARLSNRPLDTLLPQTCTTTTSTGTMPATGTPATLCGTVNLTMPASAWLGLTDNPGEAGGPGALDADTCRDLATTLAANPATRWCVTLVNPNGHAIAHGCARAGPGPPGSADPAVWLAKVKITPIETGTCEHRRESAGYQPSDSLRHVIKTRSRRCGFPGCRRPAVRCDDDHTIPYDKGGKTCECNMHPLCRRHHQAKQAPGWRLDQPHPGKLIWTLPSGRTCMPTTEPYPT